MIERRVLKEKEKRRVKKKKKEGGGEEGVCGGGQGSGFRFHLKKKKVTFFKVKSLFSLK